MSSKRKERRAKTLEGKASAKETSSNAADALRKRRNRRFLFVGVLAILFPILELIAYQFRAITISLVNRSEAVIEKVKITYPGGELEATNLKPGGSFTRLIRPNFSFNSGAFSSYALAIRYTPENAQINGYMGRIGTIDYSATEIYTFIQTPPNVEIQLQHTSRPGFPLSLIRDLLEQMGFG